MKAAALAAAAWEDRMVLRAAVQSGRNVVRIMQISSALLRLASPAAAADRAGEILQRCVNVHHIRYTNYVQPAIVFMPRTK
jgi:hypothetical protein